jgi:S-adenosylmethionine:tRNA-ribosyltransferase-isomerase (queuine synthetase)
MESIVIKKVNNKKEFPFVKSLLERLRIDFQVVEREEKSEDKVKFTKEEYWEKLEKAMAEEGKIVTDEYIQSLLR